MLIAVWLLISQAICMLLIGVLDGLLCYHQKEMNSFTGFYWPLGVALDSSDNIYVVDGYYNTITVLSSNGTLLNTFKDGFVQPRDVAIDISGNIYVADTYNNRIVILASNGTQLNVSQFLFIFSPYGIAVDIYVADTDQNRIIIFSSTGKLLNLFSDSFSSPTGVSVDNSGNIYVADANNNRIFVLSSGGTQLFEFTDSFNYPT